MNRLSVPRFSAGAPFNRGPQLAALNAQHRHKRRVMGWKPSFGLSGDFLSVLLFLLMLMSSSTAAVAQSPTSTALSSSGTVKFNQAVTFTATVTSSGCTPTGSVTFADTSTVLGTATLVSGSASIMVSTLSAGSHSITAFYSGDSNCAASMSPPFTQSIAGANVVVAQQLFPQQPVRQITAVGGSMRIVATLTNNDVSLVNVTFSETLSGKGYISSAFYTTSSDPTQQACSVGGMITCDIGNLAAGETATINMKATPFFTRSLVATGSTDSTVNTGISNAEVRLMPFVH